MESSYDALASTLERCDHALLTSTGEQGCIHTCSVRIVPGPFHGRLWLASRHDAPSVQDIGSGADVTLSFEPDDGPRATVCGWAVVLRQSMRAVATARSLRQEHGTAPGREQALLICVEARAAQMRNATPNAGNRVFAFPTLHPHLADDRLAIPAALTARLFSSWPAALDRSGQSACRSSTLALTGR